MKKIKIGLGILIIISILTFSGIATARTNTPEVRGKEKIVFIHYKKDFARLPLAKPAKAPTCYGFLSKEAKWRTLPVNYVIDPDNSSLPENFVTSAISAGAEEWDSWTTKELFNDTYTVVHDGSWDNDAPDDRNELLFGNYPQPGVIAVTVVWGYFSGPPSTREITEFDVLFDTDFTWGNADFDKAVMDLQNIATHEIGHGVGLTDVYQTACSQATMYGYSDYGDIIKRDLAQPDITGLQKLYGF